MLVLRAGWLFAAYLTGSPSTQRYQVEAACTIFVVCGLAARVWWSWPGRWDSSATANRCSAPPLWTVGLWCAASLALYWPALHVGYLSDDFVLITRVSRGDLGAFNAAAFRPLPLAVWWLVLGAGGGPRALHAVNLLVHGANAFLVTRIVQPYVDRRAVALFAGALFLASPIACEPVVWCACIFDLTAAMFVSLAVLTARGYRRDAQPARRLALFALFAAGLLSKEAAAVAPILVLIDMFAGGWKSRRLIADSVVAATLATAYGAVRLVWWPPHVGGPISRYVLQRTFFQAFSGFALPWHAEVIHAHVLLPLVYGVALCFLLAAFFLERADWRATRVIIAGGAWIAIAVVPTLTFLYVTPDLQQSRYLYVSSIGWAIVLAALAARVRWTRPSGFIRAIGVSALVALSIVGTRLHVRYWNAAGELRDRVEAAAANTALRTCGRVTLRDLPDSASGAYVLRHGAEELFARDDGLRVTEDPDACVFRWDGERFVREREPSIEESHGGR